jgi:outer membrane protein OmpA-like peptidoglycan-associated protein
LEGSEAERWVRTWLGERELAARIRRWVLRDPPLRGPADGLDHRILHEFRYGHWTVFEAPAQVRGAVKSADGASPSFASTSSNASPPPEQSTPEKTWFEVTVLDVYGKPVDGAEVVFTQAGKRQKAKTNGQGIARWSDVEGTSFATVKLANLEDVREALKDRWGKSDPVETLAGEKASLYDDEVSAPLTAESPSTLVLFKPLTRVRFIGMHFDTNKCFLRETAMSGIRQVVSVYEANPTGKILIVGHTDTAGDSAYNLDLSVERAEAVKAYLTDDVGAWEAWFAEGKPEQKRWGHAEVMHMISALPCAQSVAGFQSWSNETRGTSLKVDGDAGPKTRKALIEAYMALDDTTLPASIGVEVHGVGEWFPRTDDDDQMGKDGVAAAENRRVELFCFPDEITPPSPGKKGSKGEPQYPKWRKQVTSGYDFDTGEFVSVTVRLTCDQRRHIPNAVYRTSQDWKKVHHADAKGWTSVELHPGATVTIEWDKPDFPNRFAFRQTLTVLDAPAEDDDAAKTRLQHLGYAGDTLEDLVADYQYKFGREVTGKLEDIEEELARWHDGGPRPVEASSAA